MTSTDKDLLYIHSQVAVQILVDDLVYDLIEEIGSDEDSNDSVESLEKYLISEPQGMARTKQTSRKTYHSHRSSSPLLVGGKAVALHNQIPSDSDSIKEAANDFPTTCQRDL